MIVTTFLKMNTFPPYTLYLKLSVYFNVYLVSISKYTNPVTSRTVGTFISNSISSLVFYLPPQTAQTMSQ